MISADLALLGDFGDLLTEPDAVTITTFTGNTRAGELTEFATSAYDPDTRAWAQEDTYPGQTTRSASLNRYTYVEGAPESYVDVLGFYRAAAAIFSQRLSAAEAAYVMAVRAQYLSSLRGDLNDEILWQYHMTADPDGTIEWLPSGLNARLASLAGQHSNPIPMTCREGEMLDRLDPRDLMALSGQRGRPCPARSK